MAIGAIMIRGFTTGIDDEDIPEEAKKQITDVLKTAIEKVEDLVESYKRGELEQMPGRSLEETLEVEAMKILGRARDQAGQIAGKHLGIENSAVIMARSGARGSMLNLSQMAGSIGQQAVRGERLSRGYWNRTLPHFKKGDLGAEAKGFVKSSYKSGLHPTEYFFHAMGGREGLVDTAVRTSRSGYMQRRLINALEDLKVKEDGTVRNTADTIIQFKFGEDGLEAGAPREVHPEEGGREGPQEPRHGPRGSEAGAEAREGQARGPRPEALGEGGRGGAGSAAHNPREGAAALGGRTGDPRRVEGDRTMAPPVCRDGALEETPWTQAQQETPSRGPPANLREV